MELRAMPAVIDLLSCAQQIKDAALLTSDLLLPAIEQRTEGDWLHLDAKRAEAAHDAMESADELASLMVADFAEDDIGDGATLLRKANTVFAYCLATVHKYPDGPNGNRAHFGRSSSAVRQLSALARVAEAYLTTHQGASV
jgi:hypothetical protein